MSSDARDGGSAKPGRFNGRLFRIGRAASGRLWQRVPPLALRTRLALTLSIAFLSILAIGGTLATEQARGSIADELAASRTVATNRVAQLLAELPASRDVAGQLQGFVRAYNGDRDVQIMLIDSLGAVRASSQPAEDYHSLPEWFVTLLAPRPATRIIPLSGLAAPITAVVVAIDPRNEIAETWGDLFYALGILIAFVLVTFAVIWIVVERALSPVEDIRSAFGRIGAGDTGAHVTPSGPPEMRALAEGLNQMVDRLAHDAGNCRNKDQCLSTGVATFIAIDGPVGSGKTAVGRMLAARLGHMFLDTGVMYRAITYLALQRNLSFARGSWRA